MQCIGEAFGVDPADNSQRQKLSIKPATLQVGFYRVVSLSYRLKNLLEHIRCLSQNEGQEFHVYNERVFIRSIHIQGALSCGQGTGRKTQAGGQHANVE